MSRCFSVGQSTAGRNQKDSSGFPGGGTGAQERQFHQEPQREPLLQEGRLGMAHRATCPSSLPSGGDETDQTVCARGKSPDV